MYYKKLLAYVLISLFLGCSQPDLLTSENKKVYLDDLRGKWILINYWADWCPPCIKEIPELNKLNSQFGDQVSVFLFNFDRLEGDELRKQLLKIKAEIPSLISDPQLIYNYDVPDALPVTFVIDMEGKLSMTLKGPQTLEEIKEALNL
jgi:thiol-disulfide isomerase/thioredoxin